ncbi:AraC family transcriptional regulator [Shinella sp.]|jgi:AraC-like DNA-binding protein|uniref:AraC family transcriptional regulator n=1 Tax=Shinella sp. TaxID=1870904 RepID=UPI0029B9926A|nr:AraC family transcriptional regulator [Shinella sp.]MDX3973518.1 AraC family transcriptional regulator [Shinella sp.]
MSIILPEYEFVDRASQSIRYLEHGWPTDACRWHSHPEYELHLITETRGKAFVGDFVGEFEAGDLFLTGPDVPHNWVTDGVTHPDAVEIRDMLVQFSAESIGQLTAAFPEFEEMAPMWELARSGIRFEGFDPTFARGHFQRIRDTRGAERIAAFLRFLVRVNEHAEKRGLSVVKLTHADANHKQSRIARIVDHIAQNPAEKMSVEKAANMAGMSHTAFSRSFHAVTGNTFVEFVNRVRIGQACSLLYATEKPVSTICYDVGFHTLASFNRQFLKMKNTTPTAYRKNARAGLLSDETLRPYQSMWNLSSGGDPGSRS